MTVGKMHDTCRSRSLLFVGFSQLGSRGCASGGRTRGTKSPPLGYGGAEAGHGAVDRLILPIEVQAGGGVGGGTRDGGGWARRGDRDCRRIGNGDARRYVADVSRRDGGQGHLSLEAAFVGERGARLHASKRAVGLWLD